MTQLRLLLTLAVLPLAASAIAAAQTPDPPLPQPRPPEFRSPPPEAPKEISACFDRLRARGFELIRADTAIDKTPGCAIDDAVKLQSVRTPAGKTIRIHGDPIVDCRLAEQLGDWLGSTAAPILAQAAGSPLRAVGGVGGYECRRRNRQADGKLSAHAQGLAIDISTFEFESGKQVAIETKEQPMAGAMAALRHAACGWFLTVLGPGSDAAHATHLHLDLQQHGASDRYRICE